MAYKARLSGNNAAEFERRLRSALKASITNHLDAMTLTQHLKVLGHLFSVDCSDQEIIAIAMVEFIVSPACSSITGLTFDLSGGQAPY
jgi:hypothetical protein